MFRSRSARVAATLSAGALALALSACGSDDSTDAEASPSGSASSDGVVTVVATTNVYGSIAEIVGGPHVKVTAFISDPSQDPHSYEATTQDRLEVSKAGIVIANGGGYDDFMNQLVESSDSDPKLLDAVEISGKTAPADGELNEHVWYDFPTVDKLAKDIAEELGSIDPDNADEFTKNAEDFATEVKPLIDQEAQLKTAYAGTSVAITEPVPGYIVEAAGLENKTPDAFSEAVEEGEDVSPAVLNETLSLFSGKQVKALLYNEQTAGPITEQVKKAATDAGIPVVNMTETLPTGQTYVQWMGSQLKALQEALSAA